MNDLPIINMEDLNMDQTVCNPNIGEIPDNTDPDEDVDVPFDDDEPYAEEVTELSYGADSGNEEEYEDTIGDIGFTSDDWDDIGESPDE